MTWTLMVSSKELWQLCEICCWTWYYFIIVNSYKSYWNVKAITDGPKKNELLLETDEKTKQKQNVRSPKINTVSPRGTILVVWNLEQNWQIALPRTSVAAEKNINGTENCSVLLFDNNWKLMTSITLFTIHTALFISSRPPRAFAVRTAPLHIENQTNSKTGSLPSHLSWAWAPARASTQGASE